jgi:hypothetical protein
VAQWLGQFTGRTHETRVQDGEDALKRAIQALRDVSAPHEVPKKTKNVRHLATRLLQARIRVLRARIARASEPRMTGQPSGWADGVDLLRAQEGATRVGGVHAILVEFGAEAAAAPNASESPGSAGGHLPRSGRGSSE